MIRFEELKDIKEIKAQGGYVYVLKCSDDTVKIGVSKNPYKRMKQIENTSGKEIIDWYLSSACKNYMKIESSLHNIFKENRLNGEWFNCNFDKVVNKLLSMNISKIPNDDSIENEILSKVTAINICNTFCKFENPEYGHTELKYNIKYGCIPHEAIENIKHIIFEHYNANKLEGIEVCDLEQYIEDINNGNVERAIVDYCIYYMQFVDINTLKELKLYEVFNQVLNFEVQDFNNLAYECTKEMLNELYSEYGKELVQNVIYENFK